MPFLVEIPKNDRRATLCALGLYPAAILPNLLVPAQFPHDIHSTVLLYITPLLFWFFCFYLMNHFRTRPLADYWWAFPSVLLCLLRPLAVGIVVLAMKLASLLA